MLELGINYLIISNYLYYVDSKIYYIGYKN